MCILGCMYISVSLVLYKHCQIDVHFIILL